MIGSKNSDDWNYISYQKNGREYSSLAENVSMLKISKANRNNIFCACSDTFSKSTDGGKSWKNYDSGLSNVSYVELINSNPDIIFISGTSKDGYGVISKSTDGGKSWKTIFTDLYKGSNISKISIKPDNENIILIGTERGEVLKSIDGGLSWKMTYKTAFSNKPIKFLSFDKISTQVAYFVVDGSGFYLSKNEGETFQLVGEISFDFEGNEDILNHNFNDLEQSPSRSGYYYLVNDSYIYKTEDFGFSWKNLPFVATPGSIKLYSIGIDPENSQNIFIGSSGVIYKSKNLGETWSEESFSKMDKGFVTDFEFTNKEYNEKGEVIYEGEVFVGIGKVSNGRFSIFG